MDALLRPYGEPGQLLCFQSVSAAATAEFCFWSLKKTNCNANLIFGRAGEFFWSPFKVMACNLSGCPVAYINCRSHMVFTDSFQMDRNVVWVYILLEFENGLCGPKMAL